MNIKKSIFASSFLLFLVPFFTYAEGPVLRSGDTVTVEAGQVLKGDFYALGETITLSGEALEDVLALGGAVTTNAPVTGDLMLVGGAVQVHGVVRDDVRVIGGEVVIAEPIAGDLVVLGGSVRVLSTAEIGGDVIFLAGDIQIDAPVEGTIHGAGDTIRIDAYVGGDVSLRVGNSLTLGDKAEVAGNVTYKSASELNRAQNAVVMGEINRDVIFDRTGEDPDYQPLVLNLLVLVFSGLAAFFMLRSHTISLIRSVFESYGRSGLIGLGMFIALPIVAIILMASVIGSVVGISLFVAYFLVIVITMMLMPVFVGVLFQKLIRMNDTITIFTIVIGSFVIMGLLFIPFLGTFLLFLLFLIIQGALYTEVYTFFKKA